MVCESYLYSTLYTPVFEITQNPFKDFFQRMSILNIVGMNECIWGRPKSALALRPSILNTVSRITFTF
jgi:hypothetical protein